MITSSNVLAMQFFLLFMMLAGLLCAKLKMIDDHARASLSDLILNVFLPCTILSSFFDTDRSLLVSLGAILLVSLGTVLLSFILSQILYRKAGSERKKVLLYSTIVSNASFLGNPVIESIYGLGALIYSAVYLIPMRIALWTVGLAVFTSGKNNLKTVFYHPCLVATYLGLMVMITGFTPPLLVSRLAASLGNCTTPVSLIVVGSVLGLVEPKKMFNTLALYFTFIRLILIPLMVMGVLLVFRPDPIISGVSVILSGTPAPITASILANKYGADRELASKIIFTSTLLSIVTIPALVWLLQMVF